MFVVVVASLLALLLTHLESIGALRRGLLWGMVIVTIIAAIRYNYGNDYPEYLEKYSQFISYNYSLYDILWGDLSDKGENGWLLLCYAMKPFGTNGFYVLVAIVSIFQGVAVYYLIKKYVPQKWMVFSFFIYLFTTSLYLGSLSGMRQHFAMTIVGFSLPLILRKKIILSTLIVLLASTIHKSSLVFFPFVLWGFFPYKKGKILAFIYISVFLFLFFNKEFVRSFVEVILTNEDLEMYDIYLEEKRTKSYGVGFFINLIPFILSLRYLIYNNFNHYKVNDDQIRMVSLSAIGAMILPFTEVVPLMSRVAYYFIFFSIFSYPFVYEFIKEKLLRDSFVYLFVVINLFMYASFFYSDLRHSSYYTYHTIFEL